MTSEVAPKVESCKMRSIHSWKDVTPFLGSVVAFKVRDFSQNEFDRAYSLNSERNVYFATVTDSCLSFARELKGYWLSRLIKPKVVSSHFEISEKMNIVISMRFATCEEVERIAKAINADQAYFEYLNTREVFTFLKKNIKLLLGSEFSLQETKSNDKKDSKKEAMKTKESAKS